MGGWVAGQAVNSQVQSSGRVGGWAGVGGGGVGGGWQGGPQAAGPPGTAARCSMGAAAGAAAGMHSGGTGACGRVWPALSSAALVFCDSSPLGRTACILRACTLAPLRRARLQPLQGAHAGEGALAVV